MLRDKIRQQFDTQRVIYEDRFRQMQAREGPSTSVPIVSDEELARLHQELYKYRDRIAGLEVRCTRLS